MLGTGCYKYFVFYGFWTCMDQGVANQQVFISLFKQRYIDVELQRFTESIGTKLNY